MMSKRKFRVQRTLPEMYPEDGILYYRCPVEECKELHFIPLVDRHGKEMLTGLIVSGLPYCIYSIGSGGERQGFTWHSFVERAIEQEKECHFLFIEHMRKIQAELPQKKGTERHG